MNLSVALIVATYNRAAVLTKLLQHLNQQTLARDLWEVVVCNDGSTDNTINVLESAGKSVNFNLQYITQKNQGQCVGRHAATLLTKAKYIVIIDDDMEVCSEFLEAYLRAFADQKKRVVIGRVYPRANWREYPLYEAMREDVLSTAHDELHSGRLKPTGTYFITQNVGFSRDFYLDVGGFDAYLKLSEDTELGWRFEKNGGHFVFCNEASAVHHSNIGTYQKWSQRQFEYGKYAVYIWEKYNCDVHLHPLRNFVNGNLLNRNLFRSVMISDTLSLWMLSLLRVVGDSIYALGGVKLGVFAYKAQLSLQYHRGVLSAWNNSRQQFLSEVKTFANHPHRPIHPLGEGPTFS